MNQIIEKSKPLALGVLIFACGIGAAHFFQPANAQGSGGGSVAVSPDGTAWVVSGGQVFHCVHGNYGDKCHAMD